MTTEEKLERLTGVVDSLPSSVVAHDNQIENLIRNGEAQDRRLQDLTQAIAYLETQWQTYINTLARH